MEKFTYYTPTKIEFGQGAEKLAGKYAKEFGATKVLLHYGSESAKRTGLLEVVKASLKEEGLEFTELGGVVPNPHLELVYEGIELCRREKVDFILAVGGGSVIDSAKGIAYGVPAQNDVWEFYEGKAEPKSALPVGAVLTIAAAGSEMSASSIITNVPEAKKRGCRNDLCRPKFALMNPELTKTLPAYHTAAGCVDVLMHTVERYFSATPNLEVTDTIAEALMRTVLHNARILTRKPEDYAARAEIMWASSLSHNGLTGCGGDGGDWACHQLGHELTVVDEKIAHGASLAAIWGSWAKYVYKENPERFARFAIEVMEVPPEKADEATALSGIEEMEEFFWAIEMPTIISELGLEFDEAGIKQIAERCSFGKTRTIGTFKELSYKDMEEIYNEAQ